MQPVKYMNINVNKWTKWKGPFLSLHKGFWGRAHRDVWLWLNASLWIIICDIENRCYFCHRNRKNLKTYEQICIYLFVSVCVCVCVCVCERDRERERGRQRERDWDLNSSLCLQSRSSAVWATPPFHCALLFRRWDLENYLPRQSRLQPPK
jgi:hypothetical protein